MALHSEFDHPHVFWSVPPNWYPGGVLFRGDQVPELLRHLARAPKTKARDALLAHIVQSAPRVVSPANKVIPPATSATEESLLPLVEDAAARPMALHVRHVSVYRGEVAWRHVSVQRVVAGPPARFIAICHRSNTLRWFRVDNVFAGRLDEPRASTNDQSSSAARLAGCLGTWTAAPSSEGVAVRVSRPREKCARTSYFRHD